MKNAFTIADGLKPGTVSLNVRDQETMERFYREILGLTVLSSSAADVQLGVPGSPLPLFVLNSLPAGTEAGRKSAGLYHAAILVPSRRTLGEILIHILQTHGYPLAGASDHGYSEALYLSDPEGNGIEIYRDKPREEWDILPDGTIKGVTEAMDAEGVLGAARAPFAGLPAGTVMGHVHLTVSDLEKSRRYYQEKLGLFLTFGGFSGAAFLAAGGYHHHVGMNIWAGRNIPLKQEGTYGLEGVSFILPDTDSLMKLKAHLDEVGETAAWDAEAGTLSLVDPNGIPLRFHT